MYRLRKFCQQNQIDPQEIDRSLSYDENMKHLESLIASLPPDLAEWDSQTEYYKSLTVEEVSGLTEEELTFKVFYSLLSFDKRRVAELSLIEKRFSQHIKILRHTVIYHEGVPTLERKVRYATGYVTIKGDVETVHGLINYITERRIFLRILKISVKDSEVHKLVEANKQFVQHKETLYAITSLAK